MTAQLHARNVAGWLTDLAALTAGNAPLAEFKERVATITGVLADTFPDPATFTRASVIAVAEECKFWPAYAQLAKSLGAWWDKHRPESAWALPAEFADAPSDPHRWLNGWVKHRGDPVPARAVLLDLIRGKAGAVYEFLVRHDPEAADIAVMRGWREAATSEADRAQARADWADPAAVHASVARALAPLPDGTPPPAQAVRDQLRLLRALLARHAPANEALVPDDPTDPGEAAETEPEAAARASAAFGAQFEATHGRKPGALSAEQLAAVRAQNPGLQRAMAARDSRDPAEEEDPAFGLRDDVLDDVPDLPAPANDTDPMPPPPQPGRGMFAWND